MKRSKLYSTIVAWSSPLLLVLIWLELLTGLGSFKGEMLSRVTLGLLNGANAGKLHTVWLTLAVGIVAYLHGIMGLLILVQRAKWIKPKAAWEIGVALVGIVALGQFLWLYWAG